MTFVSTSSFAKSLRSISCFLYEPLGSPYKAKHIPSKMVVFPAPVSPEIKKMPSRNFVKSITVFPANGPNADNTNVQGLIESPPQKLTVPVVISSHPDQCDFASYKTVQITPSDFDLKSDLLSSGQIPSVSYVYGF